MGSKLLFEDLSFSLHEGDRVGLIGPNGSGKSTLLKIIAGIESLDEGEFSVKNGVNISYVRQEEVFDESLSVHEMAMKTLIDLGLDSHEAQVQSAIFLTMAGFSELEQKVSQLSGGWRKRLGLAIAFAQDPDLLILDEPTNHMDWDAIFWLESQLKMYKNSFIIVSHDRRFLDNLCNQTMEINPLYRNAYLSFDCAYQEFLSKKQEYIQSQLSLEESMSNKARRELDWLRAGVKARTTKSQSRAKEAHRLLDDLAQVKSRNLSVKSKLRLEVDSAGKKSKKLFHLKNIDIFYKEKILVKKLDLLLGPKTCLGILGANGSGKTSLLRVMAGISQNYTGDLFRADDLEVVYFDQRRKDLPQEKSLLDYLGDGSDYLLFKGQSLHVASYASRFLFSSEKMNLSISHLSGGEQARLLIAKLLLEPADVLILDEPTNDLDIDSIEVLEETLSSFEGLIILVSHDRYFLSKLCHQYLALEGNALWQIYSDLNQWLKKNSKSNVSDTSSNEKEIKKKRKKKVSLSYKEKRQLETIESDINEAEQELEKAQASLELPEVFSDQKKLMECLKAVEESQVKVDELYQIWEQLEEKLKLMDS